MNYEQQALDEERKTLDEAGELGAQDARCNVPSDPDRHHLDGGRERAEYLFAFDQEVRELIRRTERELHNPITPETQAIIRQSIVGLGLSHLDPMGEDGCRRIKPRLPSQRFRVHHMSSQDCELNPNEPGFATYDAAALDRDRLLEDDMLENGDYITIEDQGCVIELHQIERS